MNQYMKKRSLYGFIAGAIIFASLLFYPTPIRKDLGSKIKEEKIPTSTNVQNYSTNIFPTNVFSIDKMRQVRDYAEQRNYTNRTNAPSMPSSFRLQTNYPYMQRH